MSDPFRLDGRVAVVTGGGGRLGEAFGRALLAAGAEVVLTGRSSDRLEACKERLGGERITVVPADVAREGSVAELFADVERATGGADVLVNNAAIASDAPLGEITEADLSSVLATNVTGVVLCAQRAAETMRSKGAGKIINIGSIYGSVATSPSLYEGTEMVRASVPYVAAKSALVNLTRDLAIRLAPANIQVNMLSPGGVEAGQPREFQERYVARTPAGRMATPADPAGALIFLASPASDYVVGQNIHVDGGFTVW